jgi:ferrous iron transport protein B
MIIGLVGQQGWHYVAMVYGSLFVSWVVVGLILNRTVKGFTPELLVEIPPYRLPLWRAIVEKLWLRISSFVREALPIVLGTVLIVNVLYFFGAFDTLAKGAAPLLTGLWGLPKEAVVALILGLIRKDVALGMLAPLALSAKQLVISSTVLAMFFPCVASFVVLIRELGAKDTLKAFGIMLAAVLAVGSLQNLII